MKNSKKNKTSYIQHNHENKRSLKHIIHIHIGRGGGSQDTAE